MKKVIIMRGLPGSGNAQKKLHQIEMCFQELKLLEERQEV